MSTKMKIFLAVSIVVLAAASRLINHPFNFTPVAAMAIFAGCYLDKKWAVILPLCAMFVSDLFIGFYNWPVMIAVYAGIATAFFIGRMMAKRKTWYNIIGGSLSASIIFFLVTNFSVWAFASWYPHTLAGLVNCFTLALPFFRNTLAGDIVYTTVFFSAYEAVMALSYKKVLSKPINIG
jgi:hypothetical protein